MKELNELVEALYPQYGAPGSRDVDISARRKAIDESAAVIAEAFRALEQRAESAEAEAKHQLSVNILVSEHHNRLVAKRDALQAKLAEMEKQEPIGMVVGKLGAGLRVQCYFMPGKINLGDELFTRPAPAINLAELVPDEDEVERIYSIYCTPTLGSKNALRHIRKEIVRNIEEGQTK